MIHRKVGKKVSPKSSHHEEVFQLGLGSTGHTSYLKLSKERWLLGGSVHWVSAFWFQLRSWFQSRGIEPHVGVHAECGAFLEFYLPHFIQFSTQSHLLRGPSYTTPSKIVPPPYPIPLLCFIFIHNAYHYLIICYISFAYLSTIYLPAPGCEIWEGKDLSYLLLYPLCWEEHWAHRQSINIC